MYIEEIYLNNFRLLKNGKIKFDKNFNLIYGKNAQGKTSLIEAIYFLASGKSFRTRKLIEQIQNGKDILSVFAMVNDSKYAIKLTKEKREFYNEGNLTKYKEYVGKIAVVSFSPEDIDLISGTPDFRRRFFNYEMSQLNIEFLSILIDFQRVIKIRNKLLKDKDANGEVFDLYNKKYAELSIKILKQRKKYIEKISYLMKQKYEELFGKKKDICLKYNSFIEIKDISDEKLEIQFLKNLESKKEKELLYGYTLLGPNKDEFTFELEGKNAKSFASQGEKKSILLALKLAIVENFKMENKSLPIFLFDDISAYFDEIRKTNVLKYLEKENIQCFFTSTEKLEISAKYIEIENGEILNGN